MSFDPNDVDPNLVIVPEDEGHASITQGEIDEVLLGLLAIKGDPAPTCRHAAAIIALLARYIHQTTGASSQQLH